MKIRYDFVTNSSSTSYIIISDGEFNLKDFIDASGIDTSSQFLDIYKELFHSFKRGMTPARQLYQQEGIEHGSFEEFINSRLWYGKELLPKILKEEIEGKEIFIGNLSNDRNEIESFFCTEEFIIEHPKLFIDAREDGW